MFLYRLKNPKFIFILLLIFTCYFSIQFLNYIYDDDDHVKFQEIDFESIMAVVSIIKGLQ